MLLSAEEAGLWWVLDTEIQSSPFLREKQHIAHFIQTKRSFITLHEQAMSPLRKSPL